MTLTPLKPFLLKAGAEIHAGDGGYSIGTRENYEEFVKMRNKSLNLEQAEQTSCDKQGEPVAWKPIETAPKDGSMILICLPRQMNIVVRAWYNKIHNFWQTDYEGEGGITRPTYFHEGDLWHPIPPLYTTPLQRKPLTDEQIDTIAKSFSTWMFPVETQRRDCDRAIARAIEAAHGIKE